MRCNSREINTLSLSALDLFATAMRAFAIVMLILIPHDMPTAEGNATSETPLQANPRPDQPYSLGMKFVPVATGPGAGEPPATPAPTPR